MSFIVEGNNEKLWQIKNMLYDAMYEALHPVLQKNAPEIAEKFEEAFENRLGYVDLTGLLKTEVNKEIFVNSIEECISNMKKKGHSDWYEPSRFEPFLEKVKELKQIV